MKQLVVFFISFFITVNLFAQQSDDSIIAKPKKSIPLSIYISPIMDGAAFAVEYSFTKTFSLNFYAFKRQSDNSIYYNTKANENLYELMFKFYLAKASKKFKPFIGPTLGSRNIIYDEGFNRRFEEFSQPIEFEKDVTAKAKYVVPLYLGFDYIGKHGFIFEYAAGISYQQSSGKTFIHGPITMPYSEGSNLRSRFSFGYQF